MHPTLALAPQKNFTRGQLSPFFGAENGFWRGCLGSGPVVQHLTDTQIVRVVFQFRIVREEPFHL